jgi:hypothetical protein
LNLTIESLSFQDPLGAVPNRGEVEGDIFLNGVPYLQTISDVTDPKTTTPIHLEPGLWVIVPSTVHPAESDPTFARMASIPHGTTINAQGTAFHVDGGPRIDPVDITPFPIGNPGSRIRFPSQTASDTATARIPQDLSVAPALTQALLDDPNSMLLAHIAGMNIVSTDVIIIDTQSTTVPGGAPTTSGSSSVMTAQAPTPTRSKCRRSSGSRKSKSTSPWGRSRPVRHRRFRRRCPPAHRRRHSR